MPEVSKCKAVGVLALRARAIRPGEGALPMAKVVLVLALVPGASSRTAFQHLRCPASSVARDDSAVQL